MLQAGIFAKPDKEATVYYLQVKHFDEEGMLNQMLHPEVKLDSKVERFLLRDGDILFAAKGAKNFAVVYYQQYGMAVASQSFLVIRLANKYRHQVMPEYLAWFINNPKTLGYLKSAAKGTKIQAITTDVLKELAIVFPSLEKQKVILKIHELRTKEISLRVQIGALRENLLQHQLLQAAEC